MGRGLALLGLLTLACVPSAPAPSPTPDPNPAPTPAPAPAWADARVDHWLPGPHQRARAPEDRHALEASCRECHLDIATEWAASQHASSWSGAAFKAAFASEPLAFCQGCHAPEVSAQAEVPAWAAQIGVGCVSCHVEPQTEQIWTAGVGGRSSGSAHRVTRSPAFAGPQACAACHEFDFPDAGIRERPLLMQSTITEHARSGSAERSCADCHMPEVGEGEARHRSHAFPGAYDREMLARSLIITATREPERVRLDLQPGEVGHAVPTGDLLRRLEVTIASIEPDQTTRELGRRWLGRQFGPITQRNGLTVRGELEDTRVGPTGTVLEFSIPAAARTKPLRWTITHQRVAHGSSEPARARVEGQITFATGILPPPGDAGI